MLTSGRREQKQELNTLLFPKKANTYDSLGKMHLALGDKELSIQNYEKYLR